MNIKHIYIIISVMLFTILMFVISELSYPVFHMLIEFLTLFIGISIFIVSLSAIKISKNNLVVRLAPGIFISTLIVFIHALAYQGMDFFVNYDANLPTQLWILSSGMQAIVFLIAIVFINKKVNFSLNILILSIVGALFTILIFLRIFPDCYIVGSGLTNFKIFSEYVIELIYVISIVILLRRDKEKRDNYFNNIILMMILFIISSFMFTQYAGVFAIQNFLGHIIRTIGLGILYYTIVINSIRKPLDTLFKQVNQDYQNTILDSAEKTQMILDSTAEGIFGVDINGICTFVNNSVLQLLGYDNEEELLGFNIHELIHHSYPNGTLYSKQDCAIYTSLRTKKSVRNDNEFIWKKDRTNFPVEFSSNPQYKDGKVIGAVVSFKDISKRIEYRESLERLSYVDNLTKLHNRRFYDKQISLINIPENYPITLIVSDINGLKFFNDSFGHSSGDKLLKKITSIFKASIRENDFLARMGGDEFVFVLPKTTEEEAEQIIKNIIEKTENEKINSLKISASYGYDTVYNETQSIENSYKNAEDAMYQEKLITLSSIRSNAVETILNTLYEKDPSSESHSRDVSILSERIAQSMGLSRTNIQEIHTAALLHDIGKIIIPIEILNKKGVLTKEEYGEIKKHSEIGFRILNSTRNMRRISLIILSHHERIDGKGYPRGISGEDIPIESRIIAVADAYDAMTTKRTYRKMISPIQALLEIKNNSGTQFDSKIIQAFEKDFKFITTLIKK
ncbi:MAG: Cyclic di-GMP phosphodiesterase response regulator RpfG [Candidatus Izimaplasma bacterium HR2]|nr:MAG: Cyclic di-GMP phosphodiesterase response regulator RpfG [Candidatus Izimaplasma bacterium HR2]